MTFDPTVGQFTSGRVCGRKEYLAHQRRVTIAQVEPQCPTFHSTSVVDASCAASPALEFDPSPPESSFHPFVSSLSSALRNIPNESIFPQFPATKGLVESNSSREHKSGTKRIRSAQDAADVAKIREIREECFTRCKKLSASMSWDKAVFISPPALDLPENMSILFSGYEGVNEEPYALEYNRSVNTPALKYEVWLITSLAKVDEFLSREREAILEQKKDAVRLLQEELQSLKKSKKEEWKRRFNNLARARRLRKGNTMHVVDTGT